jgi:hypothetical protein
MARSTPRANQEKMQRMINAWDTLASAKSFGGMTLTQFKSAAQPAIDASAQIEDIEDQLTGVISARDAADVAFAARAQRAVNGILAHHTEGPDSALYEAMGYTRKSDRRSGLTRKTTRSGPTKP